MSNFQLPIVLLAAILVTGCTDSGPDGPPRFETSGMVLFDETPVPDAQVVFYSPKHRVSRGAITGEDGQFRIRAGSGNGLPAGEYQVAVRPAPKGEEELFDIKRPDIPTRYRLKKTSPLKETISEGDNHIEIKLSR